MSLLHIICDFVLGCDINNTINCTFYFILGKRIGTVIFFTISLVFPQERHTFAAESGAGVLSVASDRKG